MITRLLICLLSLSVLMSACKSDATSVEATKETGPTSLQWPDWIKNGNIYEVNIRQYTEEGTFDAFARHLPRLQQMGVKILWFMPIFPISETKRKGTLGSYYAVSDFRETNPEFGSRTSFNEMVAQAHELGMKVILDWVPNHTGWDHKWITDHPDYYTKGADGQITDPINPETGESWGWSDVADLNYDNPAMRKQMLADLKYWISDYDIDGYRFDVSHGVPLDFWETVTPELLDLKNDIFLLSESEIADHVNLGLFHAIYGWEFHHLMNAIAKGEKTASEIDTWRAKKDTLISKGVYMNFTSNHDENSWAGTTDERMGAGANTFAVLAATLDGIPLVYGGQEEPLSKRLEFFEKDIIKFERLANHDLYSTLLKLKRDNKALSAGTAVNVKFTKLADSDHVYAFSKEHEGDKVVVIVNLSDKAQEISLLHDINGVSNSITGGPVNVPAGTKRSFEPWEYFLASSK